MGPFARQERGFGRRRSPRLSVGLRARLITPDGTQLVVIEDLSLGGARITLPGREEFTVCVLRWMDFHAFADVAWRDGASVGLQFDRALTEETLEATGQYAWHRPSRERQQRLGLRAC